MKNKTFQSRDLCLRALGTTAALFVSLTIIGIVKILMVYFKFEQGKKIITSLSVGLSIIAVLFLAMAREPYAITVMFLLLLIKGGLLYKQAKAGQ